MAIFRGEDFALGFREGGHHKRLIFALNLLIFYLFYDLDLFCEVQSRCSWLSFFYTSVLTCVICYLCKGVSHGQEMDVQDIKVGSNLH